MKDESSDTVLIVGASGGIGSALVKEFLQQGSRVLAVSRQALSINHQNLSVFQGAETETDIDRVIGDMSAFAGSLTRVVICSGILHRSDDTNDNVDKSGGGIFPEKKLEELSVHQLTDVLTVNTILPSLWVAKLLPLLAGKKTNTSSDSLRCVLTVLSARVGSIADNRLGGWYSYRTSKAALNMMMKTAAIEYSRRAKGVKLLAFHPGTTETELSRPFQSNVPSHKLFKPVFVAQQLIAIMNKLPADGELSYLDWDGKSIPW